MIPAVEQLGGEETLKTLINAFYDLIESDPAVNELHCLHFRGHGIDHTRQAQFEFMSGFLGGASLLSRTLWPYEFA